MLVQTPRDFGANLPKPVEDYAIPAYFSRLGTHHKRIDHHRSQTTQRTPGA
jgi:hypothetical protein